MAANAVVAVACLVMVALIVVPLYRLGQLRTNQLAMATVVVFLVFGLQRASQVGFQVVGLTGDHAEAFAASQRNTWWLAMFQLLVATVAVYYLARRKAYGRLLIEAFLFDSFSQRQRVEMLEAQHVLHAARAEAEAERDAHAAMLQSVIHNSKSLISVKDLRGHYLMVNQQFEQQVGLQQAALLGHTDDLIDPSLAPVWRVNDLLAQQGLVEVEEFSNGPTGRRFYETAKFPIRDATDTVYATCCIALDVTERKRVAELVTQARDAALAANAAKSTFLATMSHEIRTPMNAVVGMTDLLLNTQLDMQQREFVETVRSSGDALIAVINDILDFSKIEAGELHLESAPFHLRNEVETCLDFVVAAASAKGLDLICYLDELCPAYVIGDVGRLRQILVNLLANAVKFTAHGDVLVTVTAANTEAGRLHVTVKVTDTGIGIDDEAVPRLFTSFNQVDASTTRVYGGTGLGLAISQRLAQAMGGEVSVTSTPGVGSTFTCEVLLDPSSHTDNTPGSVSAAALAGKTVLLVDDNPTNLRILDLQLTGLGMVCTTATSAETALKLVSEGYTYNVGVVDLHMPGMDGIELGRSLKQHPHNANAPLVLLTSVGWMPNGFESAFAAHLTKPTRSALLNSTLVELLSEPTIPTPDTATTADPPPRQEPLQILLAEDNLVNQRVAQLMLNKLGHHVDTVSTGREAVDATQTKTYDIILMDIQMPDMDGLEATRRIQNQTPTQNRPYIIAMTASALVEDRDACTAAGMDNYLSKPVRAQDLKTMLHQTIKGHQ